MNRHEREKEISSEIEMDQSVKCERSSSSESNKVGYNYPRKKKRSHESDEKKGNYERKNERGRDLDGTDSRLHESSGKSSSSMKRGETRREKYFRNDKYDDVSKKHSGSDRKGENYGDSRRKERHLSQDEDGAWRHRSTRRQIHRERSPKDGRSSSREHYGRRRHSECDKYDKEYKRSEKVRALNDFSSLLLALNRFELLSSYCLAG